MIASRNLFLQPLQFVMPVDRNLDKSSTTAPFIGIKIDRVDSNMAKSGEYQIDELHLIVIGENKSGGKMAKSL